MTRVTGGQAGNAAPLLTFASPQDVEDANLAGVPDLAILSVGVVNDRYLYRTSAPATTPDGLNVIAPLNPANTTAYRLFERNVQAQFVSSWAIDPVAGDDRNSGAPGSPLKTLLEWSLRMRFADVTTTAVNVAIAAGTLTDMAPLDLHIGTGRLITIQGAVTSTAPRALTAVTATNAATNTRGTVGDAGGAFARSQRLRMTSGAASGAIAYCEGGTVAATATVSPWSLLTSFTPPGNVLPSTVAPSIADTYVTDTLATTFQGRIDLRVKGAGRLVFKDIVFTSDPSSSFAAYQYWRVQSDQSTAASVMWVGCRFDANCFAGWMNATGRVVQSIFLSSCTVGPGSTIGMAHNVHVGTTSTNGALTVFGAGAYAQLEGAITLDGGRIVQTAGGFIETQSCTVEAGATATGGMCWEVDPGCYTYQHGATSRLWGPTSGYTIAIRTYSAAAYQYLNVPTLAGSTVTDARIAGTDKLWAALPFANTSNLSEVVALP